MIRTTLIFGISMAITGCQSAAEKEGQEKAAYAAYTAGSCRHAHDNIVMVEGVRSAVNKPQKDTGGGSFAKTVCHEAYRVGQ